MNLLIHYRLFMYLNYNLNVYLHIDLHIGQHHRVVATGNLISIKSPPHLI